MPATSRVLLLASLVPPLLLAGCGGEAAPPEPRAVGGEPVAPLLPPVLTPAQKLAVALTSTPFTPDELPAGVIATGGERTPPAERLRPLNAESKVTLTLKGPHDSDVVSYTVYTTPEDAARGFALIGDPVSGRIVVASEKLVLDGFKTPAWGETTVEEYRVDGRVRRTTAATLAGNAVVLAQTSARIEGSATPPAPAAFVSELLAGAVRHVERVAGSQAPAPASSPAAAAPQPSPGLSVPAAPTPR